MRERRTDQQRMLSRASNDTVEGRSYVSDRLSQVVSSDGTLELSHRGDGGDIRRRTFLGGDCENETFDVWRETSVTIVPRRLEGKAAIITGASRGIGLAIAHRLVSEGARVCITARNQDALREAVDALGGPLHAIAVSGKSDDVAHQAETVATTVDAFGGVHLLVNNTGINPVYGPLIELDLGAARKIFEVNCLAALSWVQQTHRAWMGQHGGSIVNMSSVGGMRPSPGISFYGASKAMLSHLTAGLAVELGPSIRVNAVAPAVVKTRFASALYEGREDEVAASYPLKRLGEPEDIGSAVAFLLSDDASWITGQTLVVDGGVTLSRGA